ncbi:MAG: hypothetical protein WCG78_01715 [Candidatus Omnitrophota bacterium]
MLLAVKSAPDKKIFASANKAKIPGLELFLSRAILSDTRSIRSLCGDFPFRYAVHAPNDSYDPPRLAGLVKAIGARVVTFHNIFWEDEWPPIVRAFKGIDAKLCIENTFGAHDAVKFIRRYGFGATLDLEHLEMECGGVYEDEFLTVMRKASHIHMTGYTARSPRWHTHIHHAPAHSRYLLDLLRSSGYAGLVVSESRVSLQTFEEFRKVHDFFERWQEQKRGVGA